MFDTSDMNLSPEELVAVEALISFNLIPPPGVVRDGKGYARWTEMGTIEAAHREDKVGSKGEQRVQFVAKIKIIPSSSSIPSSNVGKPKFERMLVNFGVLKGKQGAAGQGDIDTEKSMSARSIKKIRQLAVAVGLDLSAGTTNTILDALFPVEGSNASVLLGTKLALSISDCPAKASQYENNQNVDNFLRVEG
jgi:hypothetical protein